MVEVGTAHGYEINDQLLCLWGAPSPVYNGVEEGADQGGWRALRVESNSHRE